MSRSRIQAWIIAGIVATLMGAVAYASALGARAASLEVATMLTEPPVGGCEAALVADETLLRADSGGGACWAEAPEEATPDHGRPKLGYCQCGCGIRCATSADCGGDPCRAFVTCC
jgi:hypothetical protein